MTISKQESDEYSETSIDGPQDKPTRTAWQRFKKKAFRMEMFLVWTLTGVAVGVALGAGLYDAALSPRTVEVIGYPGELFLHALQLLILPLISFALMCGVFSLRGSKTGSGRIVAWSLCYYLLSMIIAIVIGIVMMYVIKPGKGSPFEDNAASAECKAKNSNVINDAQAATTAVDSLMNLGRDLIPSNIVEAAYRPNFLGVMVFAVTLAIFLVKVGDRAEPVIQGIEILNDVTMKIISLVILFTPVGTASFIASTMLKACNLPHLIKSLALFVVTVLSSLGIHFFIGLPITVFVMSRTNPFRAMKNWLPALAMALGTSSSAATMPVSMNCAVLHGCKPAIINFVIPLGTNVNRDGTALYEAMAVVFIREAHGNSFNIGQLVVVVIVATLAATGTASIPNAGLITLITAMQATGNKQYLSDISLLYAVDWIMGMVRTAVNVWGDACACCVVDQWAAKYASKDDILALEVLQKEQEEIKLEGEKHDPDEKNVV